MSHQPQIWTDSPAFPMSSPGALPQPGGPGLDEDPQEWMPFPLFGNTGSDWPEGPAQKKRVAGPPGTQASANAPLFLRQPATREGLGLHEGVLLAPSPQL